MNDQISPGPSTTPGPAGRGPGRPGRWCYSGRRAPRTRKAGGVSKPHYYSQHASALRAELGRGRPARRPAPAARASRRRATSSSPPGSSRSCWRPARGRSSGSPHPLDLAAARRRPGLHRLQLHGPAARGRAPRGVRAPPPARRAAARLPLRGARAASRRRSSRAGTSTTTPSWARPRTIRSGITCRRRSTRAGTSCSTARRRCSRSTSARRGASRPRTRRRCSARIARERRLSIAAHLAVLGAICVAGRLPVRRSAPTSSRCSSSFRSRSR